MAERIEPFMSTILQAYHEEGLTLQEVVERVNQPWLTHQRLTIFIRQNKLKPAKRASPRYHKLNTCKTNTCMKKFKPRVWNQHHCDECMPIPKRSLYLQRKFNITQAQYDAMFEACEGKCAGCLRKMVSGTGVGKGGRDHLNIDHDHITGRIRGLLCSNCNRSIGYLGDDPKTLRRLADYLEMQSE